MDWTDEGIIIGTRRHGETSLIVELMTPGHGRHLGLVRGGRSRSQRPVLQPGNSVQATWRARLDEHLGNYALEPATFRAAKLMETPAGLYGLQALAGLRAAPAGARPASRRSTRRSWRWSTGSTIPCSPAALIVRFELRMLEELGFGLDLERCAATGTNDDLAYVSPKSGRAVSRSAGDPYRSGCSGCPRSCSPCPAPGPAATISSPPSS